MRKQLQLWLIFQEGGQKSDKLNSRAALWCCIRRRIPTLSWLYPFLSMTFLCKFLVLWIGELGIGGSTMWICELYKPGGFIYVPGRFSDLSWENRKRADASALINCQNMWQKRSKRKAGSGCLCRDSVLMKWNLNVCKHGEYLNFTLL